jgi:hypothetical protein
MRHPFFPLVPLFRVNIDVPTCLQHVISVIYPPFRQFAMHALGGHDHPGFSQCPPAQVSLYDSAVNNPQSKVACIQCWNACLIRERAKDDTEIREGKRAAPREQSNVEAYCVYPNH